MSQSDTAPGYWMNETSGVLRPAVEAYLNQGPMTPDQIAAMQAYLKQWMNQGHWYGPGVRQLYALADAIATRTDINVWLNLAEKRGIDPL